MQVIKLRPTNALPADLSAELRALADRIDAGEIKSFVCACTSEEFEFLYGSSLQDSMLLAVMLHSECLRRLRE